MTTDAPITLLYIRAPEDAHLALEDGLARIVDRYAPIVELRAIAPGDVRPSLADYAQRTPTVLVLRHGEVVGEAIGAFLPVRELDRVVRCAVEWPR